MKKVLILGVASVQMDAILQLKEMGCETYACGMAKDGPGADAADHFDVINILGEPALIEHIQKNKIDVVYSTGSDLAMPVACRISEKLDMPHFVSSEVAYICNHKNTMRDTLTSECKGNIPYQVMSKPEQVMVPFPAMLKPSDAQGQRGIFLINSQSELQEHFEDARKFSREGKVIVEKYIDGPELSVNGYMVDGKLKYLVASDRDTWPEYTGLIHKHIVPTSVMEAETVKEVQSIFEDACQRVGIMNGPVYFQMKLEGQTPYIIEMTPRLDGCHMWNILNRATGVNLMKLTFEHLLHNDVSELDKWTGNINPMELVFFCQEPNSIMDRDIFGIPDDVVDSFWYYETGDFVRPVNGRYDKVGYYIHNK
ncbi:MAG: ATP-grasp domain-containing protein [Lachnospiraceae bacterium]|nr:ATP-grasp domain-containing protein [Lachnospiraceae bacterium]